MTRVQFGSSSNQPSINPHIKCVHVRLYDDDIIQFRSDFLMSCLASRIAFIRCVGRCTSHFLGLYTRDPLRTQPAFTPTTLKLKFVSALVLVTPHQRSNLKVISFTQFIFHFIHLRRYTHLINIQIRREKFQISRHHQRCIEGDSRIRMIWRRQQRNNRSTHLHDCAVTLRDINWRSRIVLLEEPVRLHTSRILVRSHSSSSSVTMWHKFS